MHAAPAEADGGGIQPPRTNKTKTPLEQAQNTISLHTKEELAAVTPTHTATLQKRKHLLQTIENQAAENKIFKRSAHMRGRGVRFLCGCLAKIPGPYVKRQQEQYRAPKMHINNRLATQNLEPLRDFRRTVFRQRRQLSQGPAGGTSMSEQKRQPRAQKIRFKNRRKIAGARDYCTRAGISYF